MHWPAGLRTAHRGPWRKGRCAARLAAVTCLSLTVAACAAPDAPGRPTTAAATPVSNPGTPELLPPGTAGAHLATTAPSTTAPEYEHPCESRDDSADGLLGVCTVDGVRYCVLDGIWSLCPGGGGERCLATHPGDPQAFSGRGGLNTVENIVPLTAGRWRAEVCLWDSPYGASSFTAVLQGLDAGRWWPVAQVDGEWTLHLVSVAGPANDQPGVAAGRWSVEFEIPAIVAHWVKRLLVTAAAGGEWTVVLNRVEDAADAG